MHILVNLWLGGTTSLPVHLMRCHLICSTENISFQMQSNKKSFKKVCPPNVAINFFLFYLLAVF